MPLDERHHGNIKYYGTSPCDVVVKARYFVCARRPGYLKLILSLRSTVCEKTPFSGNTPFSSQTGGKRVQNSSFRDISVLALQNAPCLHAIHIKARGVFPTAGNAEG